MPGAGAGAPRDGDASSAERGSGVVLDGGYLRPAGSPAQGIALPPRVAAAVRQVLADLAKDPFAAPDGQRLRQLGLDAKALATAARGGLLLRVADQVVLAPGADTAALAILAELPAAVHHVRGAPGAGHLAPGGDPAP